MTEPDAKRQKVESEREQAPDCTTAIRADAGNAAEQTGASQPVDVGSAVAEPAGDQQPAGATTRALPSESQEAEVSLANTAPDSTPPTGSAQPRQAPQQQQEQRADAAVFSGTPGAYSQRERHAHSMEIDGKISFHYVENDGTPDNMMRLIALKNVFSKQLPNMPREYIARLVLDRRHRSVALCKGTCSALGGITYRPFHEQAFAEIAFCAVAANEQVKGFGTRLMNYAKEFAKTKDGIRYFLTYADNAAVGYFMKQGFSKEPRLAREIWQGYIKEYDSVTLMECDIQPQLTHTHLPDLFQGQRLQLDARMRLHSRSHIVHPGRADFRAQLPIADIPGVMEAGWRSDEDDAPPYKLLLNRELQEASCSNLRNFMLEAVQHVMDNEGSWPFVEPVSASDVPDYYTIVKDPIDLGTMKARLVTRPGHYMTLEMLTADVRRMCANARVYNAADTPFYKLAEKMESLYEQYLNAHLILQA